MIPAEALYLPGELVQLTTQVRNDGSASDSKLGTPLLEPGARGVVVDVGLHLNRTLIYRVNFGDAGLVIGCRDVELQPQYGQLTTTLMHGEELLAASGTTLMVIAPADRPGYYQVQIDNWQCELPQQAFSWLAYGHSGAAPSPADAA